MYDKAWGLQCWFIPCEPLFCPAGDQEKNVSVAVGISYTEYYLNYAQFGMTAFSATSGTLRHVLLQETEQLVSWTKAVIFIPRSCVECPMGPADRSASLTAVQWYPKDRDKFIVLSVPQRGVWAHQLHAGAEGAVSVHRHRVLIIPGRRSCLRHQLPVDCLPKVHPSCTTWESCHASPLHLEPRMT